MTRLTALSLSCTLQARLRDEPFAGYVAGVFRDACNLMDDRGRVIVLALPEVGNGPFLLVVDSEGHDFAGIEVHQAVWMDAQQVILENTRLDLHEVALWNPHITCLPDDYRLPPSIRALLKPYSNWSHLSPDNRDAFSVHLMQASQTLQSALTIGRDVDAAAAALVGLGRGSTPAGDDYLVGVMAALWFMQRPALLPNIFPVESGKTTPLSATFLSAASSGQFAEPWHQLVGALASADSAKVTQALKRIQQIGASSGLDALTGLTSTLLNFS